LRSFFGLDQPLGHLGCYQEAMARPFTLPTEDHRTSLWFAF
jgi:hypothetical protein